MDTTRWGEGVPGADPAPQESAYDPALQEFAAGPESPSQDPDYPFEEPETAPELRQERSESLYSRSAPFWDRVVQHPAEGEEYPRDPGYWSHPEELKNDVVMRVRSDRPIDLLRRFVGSNAAKYVVGTLALLALVAFLLSSVFMTVRSITVEGNERFSAEEVIACSQLTLGMSTFDIDEELVKERISRGQRYLVCTLVDVAFDRVVLHVKERQPVVSIVQNGRRVTLDNRGWVLEISSDMNTVEDGLIEVEGLDVQKCDLGQAVTLRMESRLEVYTELLVEMKALGLLNRIAELDMTNMDSITLKTRDGFTVELGNENRIHAKLRALQVVWDVLLEEANREDVQGGTIVVTDPTKPAFSPPGTD